LRWCGSILEDARDGALVAGPAAGTQVRVKSGSVPLSQVGPSALLSWFSFLFSASGLRPAGFCDVLVFEGRCPSVDECVQVAWSVPLSGGRFPSTWVSVDVGIRAFIVARLFPISNLFFFHWRAFLRISNRRVWVQRSVHLGQDHPSGGCCSGGARATSG